jgi:hypothetical protein
MQVQLFVDRDQNECIVNLAGTAYKFKRNEHGHLVSEITDQEHIKWVSASVNTSFRLYVPPKVVVEVGLKKPPDMPDGTLVDRQMFDESELLPYPKKGSKRPPKRSES